MIQCPRCGKQIAAKTIQITGDGVARTYECSCGYQKGDFIKREVSVPIKKGRS